MFTFPMTSYSLQLITSERIYGTVNMDRRSVLSVIYSTWTLYSAQASVNAVGTGDRNMYIVALVMHRKHSIGTCTL